MNPRQRAALSALLDHSERARQTYLDYLNRANLKRAPSLEDVTTALRLMAYSEDRVIRAFDLIDNPVKVIARDLRAQITLTPAER